MRIELAFDPEGVALIEEVKNLTGIRTHKDFFNNTITLFDWAVAQHLEGRIVVSMDEEKKDYSQLLMPPLSRVSTLPNDLKSAALQRRRSGLYAPALVKRRAAGGSND
jgi:hypothetical protein